MTAPGTGSWPLADELFERGDPAFVDELRRITDADRLGTFAAKWLADRRPVARQLLVDYLSRPLNAFRHEALVKRLFKRVETAGDDELMGCFLVLFDRSVRRVRRTRREYRWNSFPNRQDAQAWIAAQTVEGYETQSMNEWNGRFHVHAVKAEEVVVSPTSDTVYRPTGRNAVGAHPVTERLRKRIEKQRLFKPRTRKYLRRRAWRYFRKLGKQHPERYIPALAAALRRYTDADVADGLALLDNWGLMHALFHHSPALIFPAKGCDLAEGKGLADLAPAPMYPDLWKGQPLALLDLMKAAQSRTVRQWAIAMLRDHARELAELPVEELFALLGHAEPEVAAFAAGLLKSDARLDTVGIDRWLVLLETDNPQVLEIVAELMTARLRAERVSLADAVRLARCRPLPVARLGFNLVRAKPLATPADAEAVLGLAEAECDLLRPEMVRWLRETLQGSPLFRKEWVLDFLDSRFAEVREQGWLWRTGNPELRDDVEVWLKLLESPYDDVKLKLVAELEARVERGEPSLVRFLWASVLVNIHRGGRAKPAVVRQVVERIDRHPDEAGQLLPLLAVALRSVRGPEFRAGLAGVVQLVERRPELLPAVREKFPELRWEPAAS